MKDTKRIMFQDGLPAFMEPCHSKLAHFNRISLQLNIEEITHIRKAYFPE